MKDAGDKRKGGKQREVTEATSPEPNRDGWNNAAAAIKDYMMAGMSEATAEAFSERCTPETLLALMREDAELMENAAYLDPTPRNARVRPEPNPLALPTSSRSAGLDPEQLKRRVLVMLSVLTDYLTDPIARAAPLPMEVRLLDQPMRAVDTYEIARVTRSSEVGLAPLVDELTAIFCSAGADTSDDGLARMGADLEAALRSHLPDLSQEELDLAVEKLEADSDEIKVDGGAVGALRSRLREALPERHRISEPRFNTIRKTSPLDTWRLSNSGQRYAGVDYDLALEVVHKALDLLVQRTGK